MSEGVHNRLAPSHTPPPHCRPLQDLQRTSAPLSSLTVVSAAGGEGGAEAQDEALTRPRLRTRGGLRPCLDGGLTEASSLTWNPRAHKDLDYLG